MRGGYGKRFQLTAQSPGFKRGVSGSCGLALPNNQEGIVSHNSVQPLLQVVCDLSSSLFLVNQAAAASTSVIHAAVTFVLY